MKRVRCPQCGQPVTFDETRYTAGQALPLRCQQCGKQFAIRVKAPYGSITVIENTFHYKQVIPLQLGENRIGRYQKGNPVNIPIATDDPSIDLFHCIITVSRDKEGTLRYYLQDANSNTGTFVDNVEVKPRERRLIDDGTLFTIGATSIILKRP